MKKIAIIFIVIVAFILPFSRMSKTQKKNMGHRIEVAWVNFFSKESNELSYPEFPLSIAHAGGAIDSLIYTNSVEALNQNYDNGFRFFEIDFRWTSDDSLVIIHDWKRSVVELYNCKAGRLSYKEFMDANLDSNLTQMNLESLSLWVKNHPNAFIISDIKKKNIKGLKLIEREYPHLKSRLIPQIYSILNFPAVQNIGYEKIILTNYKKVYSIKNLLLFLEKNKLFALTVPRDMFDFKEIDYLLKIKTPLLMHTINDSSDYRRIINNGVHGVYTDYLF